jgi:hypothetical protein
MRETADVLTRLAALETELARLRTLVDAPPGTSDAAVPPHEQTDAEPSASRRDLLRYGAVALGAAVAAGMAVSPAEAADGGALIIGGDNTANGTTRLTTNALTYAFSASAPNGFYGVFGSSSQLGVYGSTGSPSPGSAGVYGVSTASTGQAPGVYGNASAPEAPGVYGRHFNGGNGMRVTPSRSSAVRASTAGRFQRMLVWCLECTATLSRPTRRPCMAGMRPAASCASGEERQPDL